MGIWKMEELENKNYSSCERSVAVFPDAAIGVEVVGLGALTLDAGAVHLPGAAQLVVRVAPAAQTRLEGHGKRKNRKTEKNSNELFKFPISR